MALAVIAVSPRRLADDLVIDLINGWVASESLPLCAGYRLASTTAPHRVAACLHRFDLLAVAELSAADWQPWSIVTADGGLAKISACS
jgi:hypothetical protein